MFIWLDFAGIVAISRVSQNPINFCHPKSSLSLRVDDKNPFKLNE